MKSNVRGSRRAALLMVLALLALTSGARADVPPRDGCMVVGERCSTAPPDYQQPGVCQERTCTRTVPKPDGALGQMSYACSRCIPNAGGAGGASGGAAGAGARLDGGNTGGAADAGTSSHDSGSSGCDCVVTPSRTASTLATIMVVAGVLALLAGRRSRRE